ATDLASVTATVLPVLASPQAALSVPLAEKTRLSSCGSSFGKIESTSSRLQRHFVNDCEHLVEQPLEDVELIVAIVIATSPQQLLHHGVFLRYELDDQGSAELCKRCQQFAERHAMPDHQVMNEGQAQHQIGTASVGQGLTLGSAPAQAYRRIDQIVHQR